MSNQLLVANGLIKTYHINGGEIEVIRGVDIQLQAGETVAVIGPSGAGKSTLLHIIGLLELPTAGGLHFLGKDTSLMDDTLRARMRLEKIGFVFQFHHLLPEFTAVENVMLPSLMLGNTPDVAREKAKDLLAIVGLEKRLQHKPGELSGGEQQRIALARALVNEPRLLLADEPTGNLDRATSEKLRDLLWDICRRHNTTLVVVTHDHSLAAGMDRTIEMVDGSLQTLVNA